MAATKFWSCVGLTLCTILALLSTPSTSVVIPRAAPNESTVLHCKSDWPSETGHYNKPASPGRRWELSPDVTNAWHSKKAPKKVDLEMDDATWELYQNVTVPTISDDLQARAPVDQCCRPTWECWNEMDRLWAPAWEDRHLEKVERIRCCFIRFIQSCPNPPRGKLVEMYEPPLCSNPKDNSKDTPNLNPNHKSKDKMDWEDKEIDDLLNGTPVLFDP